MSSCKKFCENVFVPEKERVELQFSKKYQKIKNIKNKSFAKTLKSLYMTLCDNIYCQKKCKDKKVKKWANSYTKKRRNNLTKMGAMSGCRDLIKEFPKYYKGI